MVVVHQDYLVRKRKLVPMAQSARSEKSAKLQRKVTYNKMMMAIGFYIGSKLQLMEFYFYG